MKTGCGRFSISFPLPNLIPQARRAGKLGIIFDSWEGREMKKLLCLQKTEEDDCIIDLDGENDDRVADQLLAISWGYAAKDEPA